AGRHAGRSLPGRTVRCGGPHVKTSGLAPRLSIFGSDPGVDTLDVSTLGGTDAVTVAPDVSQLINPSSTSAPTSRRLVRGTADAAYASGVRYFDAARSYGKAEAFLSSWLRGRGFGPEEVTVGSKWGYTYTGEWRIDADVHEVKDLSAATFRRQLAETRELLGDHLRLYQIHSATLDSGVLDDREVLAALAELRSGGVFIGLTTSGPRQAETIERALEVGAFDSVQSTWNTLERSAGP